MSYSSKIANLLLITPYDNRANVADSILEKMSEEEFCNHCYSKPKFSRKTPFVPESDNYTDDDYRISTEDLERQRYNQTRSYENFNTWLSSFKNSTVYTINGNAGTGKTTFINHERYTNKSIEWIIMDIYRAPSHIEWISDISTDIKSFNKAAAKVYGCLLNKIQHLIFRQTDDDGLFSIDKTYKKLCSLSSNCNGVQREHNKKLNNGLPILHKVPPKRDYGRYFCILAEKGGTTHGGLTEKLSPFFHAKKQEVIAYGR